MINGMCSFVSSKIVDTGRGDGPRTTDVYRRLEWVPGRSGTEPVSRYLKRLDSRSLNLTRVNPVRVGRHDIL